MSASERAASAPALLRVEGLRVGFPGPDGWFEVVRGVDLEIQRGEMVGLVGESGSGKSLTALALLGLVPAPGRCLGGSARFDGVDLLSLPEPALRPYRGGRLGYVFQEPMTALDPVYTVGFQLVETIRVHRPIGRREAREEALRLLELVALPEPARRLRAFPHQLSGGQRQRVMIALALAGEPDLLLADEPTTALDVTLQAQILRLLSDLRDRLGLAILLVTHDLAVVAQSCRRVVVLYAGEVVETGATKEVFRSPLHPYARGLLEAVPRLGRRVPRGELPAIPGQVPEPAARPTGCAFHPRCPEAFDLCPAVEPKLLREKPGREVRCLLYPGAPEEGS